MNLTTDQVLALASDAASAQAGSRLAEAGLWHELGQSPSAVWGKCQGSALYQVRVDLGDTTVSCSCPSRKLPCKHGLGLLLLAARQPDAVPQSVPPPWMAQWLSKRAGAQARREATIEHAGEDATTVDPDAAKRRKAQSKRTSAARERAVAAGLDTLDVWLNDLVRNGLAGLESRSSRLWEEQAARMVDAKAPAIATRVRAMAAIPSATPDWPERLLDELGRLALLSEAYRSIDRLDPPLAADIRSLIGWTLNEDEVVERGEAVSDDWIVLSDDIGREDRLQVRRSWLLGAETRRIAQVLQYATNKTGFDQSFVIGTHQRATLVYWPGAYPQRALLRERSGKPRTWDGPLPAGATISELLGAVAEALACQPWIDRFACVLGDVVPVPSNERWTVQDAAGNTLPLPGGEYWTLLALSGGAPVTLAGVWDGRSLRPLGVSVDGRYRVISEQEAGAAQPAASAVYQPAPLAALALAGTAKTGGKQPAGTPELEELFAGQPHTERQLLLLAAAERVYRQAGYVARSGGSLPSPAPVERLGACSARLAGLLDELFTPRYQHLVMEVGPLMAEANLRLPYNLLPRALDLSAEQHRSAIRPVLGERGRWLARALPQWAWAAEGLPARDAVPAGAERTWQEGSPPERRAILGRVLAVDPELARTWIRAAWRQETAELRAGMLDIIRQQVVPDDEPLLEAALDDRSTDVRSRAATLLATLPGSALADRMRERADRLLELGSPAGGLRGLLRSVLRGAAPAGVLKVTLPEELPKDWQRDGISAKPPSGIGERSWWLIETLALVHPAHWVQRWGLPAGELLRLAADSEESTAVLEGWSRAAVLHGASDWATALWEYWGERKAESVAEHYRRAKRLAALLPLLPRDEAERRFIRSIHRWEGSIDLSAAVASAFSAPWSDALARAFLDAMRDNMKVTTVRSWAGSLEVAAHALPPGRFDDALGLQAPDNQYVATTFLRPFLATIEFRRRLHRELKS